jgi:hypothetical protein
MFPTERIVGKEFGFRRERKLKGAEPKRPSFLTLHGLQRAFWPFVTTKSRITMAFARTQHNLTLLPDGMVLVTGGSRNSDVYDLTGAVYEAELWSPTTETYATLARMTVPRLYHSTALLLPDARVLVAGGGRFGVDQLSAEACDNLIPWPYCIWNQFFHADA